MEERLQKILSRAGVASRRGAETVMSDGRVTVNGTTVRELGTKADVTTDDIRVDGVRIKPPKEPVYLLLNKPKGVITTRHDPEGRPTIMTMVPAVQGLFPVGRLDIATEGLIILTNDGAFAERVSHPRYEVPRVYHAKVRRVPDADAFERMRRGVVVEGQRLRADAVRLIEADNNSWVEVTLHEGRNHEVRRLLEAVGHPVSKLRRVAIGPLTMKGLDAGMFRSLTPGEVAALQGRGKKPSTKAAAPAKKTSTRGTRDGRRPAAPGSAAAAPRNTGPASRDAARAPRVSSSLPAADRPWDIPAPPPPEPRPPRAKDSARGRRPATGARPFTPRTPPSGTRGFTPRATVGEAPRPAPSRKPAAPAGPARGRTRGPARGGGRTR